MTAEMEKVISNPALQVYTLAHLKATEYLICLTTARRP